MIRDITIGQYYPADSMIHKLDPRTKLVGTIAFIVSVFLFHTFLGYAVAGVFLARRVDGQSSIRDAGPGGYGKAVCVSANGDLCGNVKKPSSSRKKEKRTAFLGIEKRGQESSCLVSHLPEK